MSKSKNTILAKMLTPTGMSLDGSGSMTGDLTIGGRITAQEFHTEFVIFRALKTC